MSEGNCLTDDRSLAYIETIKSLKPILGADKIELAEILGWEVIVKRGDFKVGDKAIYIETDATLPELPCFEFLRSKKFLIKIMKMRGVISQGIVFPLSILNEVDPVDPFTQEELNELEVGTDLTKALRITKHDPEAIFEWIEPVKKSWLANKYSWLKWKLLGIKPVKRGSFPSDCRKTEAIRVQKMGKELAERAGELAWISEKIEGQSMTCIYRQQGNWLAKLFQQDNVFQVCSRNQMVFNSEKGGKSEHHLVKVAEKYHIKEKMQTLGRNLALQMECCGGKVQGNPYKLSEHEIRVFSIWDIDQQKYLPFFEMKEILEKIDLPMVPVLDDNHILQGDVKAYVEMSQGKSQLRPQIEREGIVVKNLDSSFSFKSISPSYLLRQE
jgi:uncharacterized protein/RNA ligase-like protein